MSSFTRRQWLGTSVETLGIGELAAQGQEPTHTNRREFSEPAKVIPVNSDADVIVCGGGPAAAIASRTKKLPHEVEWPAVNDRLTKLRSLG